ncbi:MAG TPA: substrate-binding domain-containing protein [Polyangiaceae bacterium]|nr:substrate-binding domain-containing protein [Polyangiaceae bacterium]
MIARTSWPPPARTRQRYALLVDSLDDEHEQSVVHGVLSAARELDARLVVIAGGPVDAADERLRAGNFAFDLIGEDSTLGVLVLSSALGNAAGPERLAQWLHRYDNLRVCCMGVPIPGQLSVRVDNAAGITAAVRHLVEVHAKRNIGFIRGPAQSDEAEVRYAAYRDALFTYGINPDPRWVAEGDYNRPSGAQAVRSILDQRRVSVHALDALVCANDYMALGALDELGRRGVNVPEQLALVGFDDVASAAASRPALTTVRQPGGELGREGMKQLALLVSGSSQAVDSVLPVELKLRRSCGCAGLDTTLSQQVQGLSGVTSFEVALMQRRQLIVAELARAGQGTFGAAGSDWESALLSALVEEMRDGKHGALSRRVQRLLLKLEQGGSDLAAAPAVLSTLRKQALACVATNAVARDRMEDAIADAQQLTTGALAQVAVSATRAAMSRARALSRQVQTEMFGSAEVVSRTLAEHLPGLGVDACVIASLLPREPGLLGQVRFGYAPGQGHPDAEAIPLSRLTEHPLVEGSRTLFLLPIALRGEALGIAAFSVVSQLAQSDLLEDLRDLLATVLKVSQTRHA